MSYIESSYLITLRAEVLRTAKIDAGLISAHMNMISSAIYNKTRLNVSETTLRRVFGFSRSKFNPSLFTLNALSIYCGYKDWFDFSDRQKNKSSERTAPLTLIFDRAEYSPDDIKEIIILLSKLYSNIGGDYLKVSGMSQFEKVIDLDFA